MGRRRSVLVSTALFIASGMASFWLEHPFQLWVRSLCEAQRIAFYGKHFQLFISPWFMFGLASWAFVAYMLVRVFAHRQALIRLVFATVIFSVSVAVHTRVWAAWKVIECTACDDRPRPMAFAEVPVNLFFLTGLALSLVPLVISRAKASRKERGSLP